MGPVADRIVVVLILGGLAAWVAWGWRSWTRSRPEQLSVGMKCSLAGSVLASISAALEISSGTYAQFKSFHFEDPVLLRIYRWGFLLAFLGLVTGLFASAKRYHCDGKRQHFRQFCCCYEFGQVMGE